MGQQRRFPQRPSRSPPSPLPHHHAPFMHHRFTHRPIAQHRSTHRPTAASPTTASPTTTSPRMAVGSGVLRFRWGRRWCIRRRFPGQALPSHRPEAAAANARVPDEVADTAPVLATRCDQVSGLHATARVGVRDANGESARSAPGCTPPPASGSGSVTRAVNPQDRLPSEHVDDDWRSVDPALRAVAESGWPASRWWGHAAGGGGAAEQEQVVEVGQSALGPRLEMVGVAPVKRLFVTFANGRTGSAATDPAGRRRTAVTRRALRFSHTESATMLCPERRALSAAEQCSRSWPDESFTK
jgi:hypothetical protein